MEIKGNKGEWSEVLVLLKLLIDGKLFIFDKRLILDKKRFLDIDCIYKCNKNNKICYKLKQDKIIIIKDLKKYIVKKELLYKLYKKMYNYLSNIKETSFALKDNEVVDVLHIDFLKSGRSNKNDLEIIFNNSFFGKDLVQGFNIKSFLGYGSTLLNSSRATNIIFKIENICSNVEKDLVDLKIKEKVKYIINKGGKLVFDSFENDIFLSNIIKLDRDLIKIIIFLVENYFTSKAIKIKDFEQYYKEDIKGVCKDAYKYKIKNFLLTVALGMVPTKRWNCRYITDGGYIILKKEGTVGALSFFNKNDFMDYLYENTKMDTASLRKHKFGNIYKEQGCLKLKLNMQIRFLNNKN